MNIGLISQYLSIFFLQIVYYSIANSWYSKHIAQYILSSSSYK